MKKMNKKNFHLKNYRFPDKFGEWLGYKATHFDRKTGTAKLELTLREDHLSPAGRVHGGVISSFFDFACGAAVFSTMKPEDFCSTVELKVNYFLPLDKGDTLKCDSKVMFRGRKLCVVHAILYRNKEKKPVAMATATFNIVSKK
ncbi:MAG: PaaI family thioesterase [Deltaproteobacteria bacterium]|nr:MAG: PaaI family thioesterase [Deltaproteobacteria bacterium]